MRSAAESVIFNPLLLLLLLVAPLPQLEFAVELSPSEFVLPRDWFSSPAITRAAFSRRLTQCFYINESE